jgi:hypothetical protein
VLLLYVATALDQRFLELDIALEHGHVSPHNDATLTTPPPRAPPASFQQHAHKCARCTNVRINSCRYQWFG